MYKIPLHKQGILTPHQAEQLFPSLEELILFHSGLCADLKERIGPVQNDVCKNIADVLLKRVRENNNVTCTFLTNLNSNRFSTLNSRTPEGDRRPLCC